MQDHKMTDKMQGWKMKVQVILHVSVHFQSARAVLKVVYLCRMMNQMVTDIGSVRASLCR